MTEALTALASENLNPSLRSLLEDVQRGHIRVPRFQRPFVWTDEQRLDLLRSIRENMPIGSLLVWRTAKFKLATFPAVGPHTIPPIAGNATVTGWQYLLDGHQRVTTLLGLLLPPMSDAMTDQEQSDDDIDWNIQYDLMDEDFVFGSLRKNAARPLLPLHILFDGRRVNKHMRDMRMFAGQRGWTEQDFETWEERADQLAYRFQQCRIPVVVMVTDDLELAAKAFQRANSQVTTMSESNLIAALTWTKDFDLKQRLDELRMPLPAGWRELDDGFFLQVCKGLAGLDMTKTGQPELIKKIEDDATLLERAGKGLARAVEWLSREAAVVRRELLPYAFQAVLLAVELDRWQEKEPPTKALLSWFWCTSWSGVFAHATSRPVQGEQARLRAIVEGDPSPLAWAREEDLPERFDLRSARSRLLTLRLAVRPGLVDAAGQPADGRALLATHGREVLMRLFPVPRGAAKSGLFRGAGNRFFLDPDGAAALRERLKVGPDLPAEALQSLFVDAEGQSALRRGDVETFLSRRAKALNDWDLAEWEAERSAAG